MPAPRIYNKHHGDTPADRPEPKFGHRRQAKYKATKGQFEKLYQEGSG
jgi:hypothetical protein